MAGCSVIDECSLKRGLNLHHLGIIGVAQGLSPMGLLNIKVFQCRSVYHSDSCFVVLDVDQYLLL